MLKKDFIKDGKNMSAVDHEVQILNKLKHDNIVQIYNYGTNGICRKTDGSKNENIVFLMLEAITGGLLFDVVQTIGGMGEDYGRFFMS